MRTWRCDDELADARRDGLEHVDDGVAERLARSSSQSPSRSGVRRVLGDDAHHVGAVLRALDEGRIGERRDGRLEDRLVAPAAVLRGVEGALHRVDRRARPRSARAARASSPAAAGNVGSRLSARLTLATTPGVRMLPARQPSDGPSATGSTRSMSVRFGSAPETTPRASISSPLARTTPVAAPSCEVIRTTSALGPDLGAAPRTPRRARAAASAPGPAPREHRLARRAAVVAGAVRRAASPPCPPTTARRRRSGPRARRARRAARPTRRTRRRGPRRPSAARAGSSASRRGPRRLEAAAEAQRAERVAEARRLDVRRRRAAERVEEPARAAGRACRTRA